MKVFLIALSFLIVFLSSCQRYKVAEEKNAVPKEQEVEKSHTVEKLQTITYKMENAKQWLLEHNTDSAGLVIALAVNRTDKLHFSRMDSVLVPTDLSLDLVHYLPFPLKVESLKEVAKIVYFSYPTQTFAVYENGLLIHTGPTNMGSEKHQTPTGLYFTNWKAKKTVSTVNDKWILKWNFNILNQEGIGWHQYDLPGYPVSHSCLRLQADDAEFLYSWADQWILADQHTIRMKGTPVIIFGKYDFRHPKPWLQLISNPQLLNISENELQELTTPFLSEILEVQEKRKSIQINKE